MRILQICSARSVGGGERHVADLSNELVQRGHNVFAVVAPGSPMPREMSSLPAENIATFSLRNALDIGSAIRIGKFVRENRIELINAHLAKDYPVAAAAARFAHVPFVITRHVLFPMHRIHRLVLRETKFVIAPSNAAAESLRRQAIFPSEKIVTIRYGLDLGRFSELAPTDDKTITIGAIGNLDPVKGFDILIRAAAFVAAKFPEIKFEIVGEDRSADSRNERDLRKLISQLNLDDTVSLAGWSSDVRQKLVNFKVFVSASRSESFGFVIAEAMLAGVPVIATATEGAKEIIASPSFGQLVPIDSPDALADAILDLLSDDTKCRELAKSGRSQVEENFSMKRMVDETETLYRRAIAIP